MRKIVRFLFDLPKNAVIGLIEGYQHLLSPDHSWLRGRFPYGYCRHYPSCSQYTKEAVARHGLIRGSLLGARRIAKCNPWSEPSIDLVPYR